MQQLTLKLAGAALAVAAVTALPATASARTEVRAAGTLDVPKVLTQKKIDSVANKSGLDVFLPSTIDTGEVKPSRIKPQAFSSSDSYQLDLGVGKNCGGATACFVAEFTGTRNEKPHYKTKVKLRGGKTGYYKTLTCGASCSPPAIEWRVGKDLYSIQFNSVEGSPSKVKKLFVKLANQAIAAGPREGGQAGQL
jgi:hypothetical protein